MMPTPKKASNASLKRPNQTGLSNVTPPKITDQPRS